MSMGANFLDLDQVVKNWAWEEYDITATKRQRQYRQKEKRKPGTRLQVHIDWSEVKFHDVTNWPRLAEDITENEKSDTIVSETKNHIIRADGGSTTASVLFMTKFKNDTPEPQEYTIKTEKTTQSSCMTEVESGYTHGIEMGITLKTPCEIFEANAGYHREMTLTNIDGQTFEEAVTWGVESVIKVKENHLAEARLIVEEKKFEGEFEILSSIRGTVFVTFTNVQDNNSAIKMVSNDISQIVQHHLKRQRKMGEPLEFVEIDGTTVVVHSKGCCKFRFGIKQEVVVHQEKLKPSM